MEVGVMRYARSVPRFGLTLAAVAAMTVLSLEPVGATVVERGHYADTFAFSYDDCGPSVDVEGEFSGVYRIREGKHQSATAFFLMDNFSYREVHTNVDTGESFLLRGNGVFNETKATSTEGNIFEFVSVEAGQPFVVEDSDGDVVIRDRGAIRRRILFDTEGDDVPGGIFIQFVSAEVHGPHPGFFIDFCDIVNDLIGP
jgi:hypothetical protein